MKRFFKKLFSRFSFVALTIILLFLTGVLIVVGGIYVAHHVVAVRFPQADGYITLILRVLDWLIVAVAVLHAANRDMLPETKIPWILCIIVLNILGVAVYIVFSYNRPNKRQRRAYRALYDRSKSYVARRIGKDKLEADMGNWASVSEALYSVNPSAVAYSGTKTEYISSGEAFAERLKEDLNGAREYIFIEFFIIAKGKLWSEVLEILKRKVREGVEVRLIYDDIGSMSRVHARYHKTLCKAGIRCVKFNPFVPVVSNVHNNRDHRKIVVVDGKTGYTGGINLADEYVNETHLYGHWKDSAVRLEGEGVKSLVLMFLHLYNLRGKEAEDFSPYIPQQYDCFEGEGYVQPYGDGPRPLYPRQIAEDVYINILNSAKRYVYIATPYLIIDYRMREALVLAAERGVDVRILTPHIPDKKIAFSLTRSNYMALIRAGVSIYEYTPGFVHAKSFVADDKVAVVGTINLDYRSLMHHFEDAVFMYGTKAVAQLKEDMDETFSVSALQTEADAKKNVVSRLICEIAKIFAPLF